MKACKESLDSLGRGLLNVPFEVFVWMNPGHRTGLVVDIPVRCENWPQRGRVRLRVLGRPQRTLREEPWESDQQPHGAGGQCTQFGSR